jgi:hypothetical protein
MNITIAIIGALGLGTLTGVTIAIFLWWVINKVQDKKIIKLAKESNIIDQVDNTKPIIDERGQEEDERRRIEKIRQFEKLRRLGIGEQTTTKSNSFYTGKFQDGKDRGLSNNSDNNIKQNSGHSGIVKSDNRKSVKLD